MSSRSNGGGIRSDVKLLSIIEELAELHRAGVTTLSDRLDMPKSTVHAHLQTLHDEEYVVNENGQYRLGLKHLYLGTVVRDRIPGYRFIKEKVDELAQATGERAQFIVEDHGHGVYVYRAVGPNAVETDSGTGNRVPLNAISAGKAILAFMPRERVEAILSDVGLPDRTDNTITDEDDLWRVLEEIRDDGYAHNYEESTTGLRAVGVPVLKPDEEVIGAISVSGPSNRLRDERIEREIPNQILGVVNEIELNIRFS
jgi:DNA-binding IclR family transcriptional regulator